MYWHGKKGISISLANSDCIHQNDIFHVFFLFLDNDEDNNDDDDTDDDSYLSHL